MRDIDWRPIATAPKDGTAVLAYLPRSASSLQTRGVHTLHWSGWGEGVWETGGGWRPLEHEVEGAVWTPLELIQMSAQQAASK